MLWLLIIPLVRAVWLVARKRLKAGINTAVVGLCLSLFLAFVIFITAPREDPDGRTAIVIALLFGGAHILVLAVAAARRKH